MLENAYDLFFYGLMREFELSAEELMFLMTIKRLSKVRGYCFASKSTLSEIMRISIPTTYKIINGLKEKGLLESATWHNSRLDIYQPRKGSLVVTEIYDNAIDDIKKTYREVKKK